MIKRSTLFIIGVMTMLCSCSKLDLDTFGDDKVGTSLAIPIGTIDATIFDLYQKFDTTIELQYDEDNTTFIYWEKPLKVDEFNFKDFSQGEELTGEYSLAENPTLGALISTLQEGESVNLPRGTYMIKDTLPYSFNFNETDPTHVYKIDSILIRHAVLAFGLSTTDIPLDNDTYIEAEISFPTMAARTPLIFKVIATDDEIDIERQIGYFTAHFSKSGTNDVETRISFKLVSDGTKEITKHSAIGFSTKFKNIDYEILHGYICNQEPICSNHTTVTLPNSQQLYEFVENNYVSLYNPEFIINITTNIGADAYLKVNEIYAMTRTGKKTNALFRGAPSFTKIIEKPQYPYEYATTTVKMNRNFGGMNELFKEIPDSLVLDWDIFIGNGVEKHNYFVLNPIDVDAHFAIRIPIWFDKGTDITHQDTLDADLTSINSEWTDFLSMKEFNVYLDFTNTLPVQADARISFLDSLGNEIFAQDGIMIDCPPIDEYGRSKKAVEKEQILKFPKEAIPNIMQTKKIAVWYEIGGYDEESTINFHATDGLRIKISAFATMTISTK